MVFIGNRQSRVRHIAVKPRSFLVGRLSQQVSSAYTYFSVLDRCKRRAKVHCRFLEQSSSPPSSGCLCRPKFVLDCLAVDWPPELWRIHQQSTNQSNLWQLGSCSTGISGVFPLLTTCRVRYLNNRDNDLLSPLHSSSENDPSSSGYF
jgi:hypothetical protein